MGIIVLSLTPFKFCCEDKKDVNGVESENMNGENGENGENSENNTKNFFDCNCVWKSPFRIILFH